LEIDMGDPAHICYRFKSYYDSVESL
jgi:hypothetical protein